jgi:hypothetical protein
MTIKYALLTSDIPWELEANVNHYLSKGWSLHGSLSVAMAAAETNTYGSVHSVMYAREMIKEVEDGQFEEDVG